LKVVKILKVSKMLKRDIQNFSFNFKFNLEILFNVYLNPKFWFMLYPYDPEQDFFIEYLIKNPKELIKYYLDTDTDITKGTNKLIIKLDKKYLWISNYPYAYGTIHNSIMGVIANEPINSGRPSRKNIYLLHKLLKNIKKEYPEYFI